MLKKGFNLILKGLFGSICLLLLNAVFYFALYLIFYLVLLVLHAHIYINQIPLYDNFIAYSSIIISAILARILYKNINRELLITTSIFYSLFLFFVGHSSIKHIILILSITLLVYFLPNLLSIIKKKDLTLDGEENQAITG